MQTLQTRSRAFTRGFVRLAAGAALFGMAGLPVAGIGGPAPAKAGYHQQAASMSVPHDYRAITKAGHRYYLYLANGVEPGEYRSVVQDGPFPSRDFSHHRYYDSGAEPEAGDDGHPQNHRIGHQAG